MTITVFGSINLDTCFTVSRLPALGETLLGGGALVSPGGKGANQAHAARLFGAEVRMIGAVGADAAAGLALRSLREAGVDLTGVREMPAAATGMAAIFRVPSGDNAIVVESGANSLASERLVSDALLAQTAVLLLQMELRAEESLNLARRARAFDCQIVLNLAPAIHFDHLQSGLVDWLILNASELKQVCDAREIAATTTPHQARALADAYSTNVIVTLGADGAHLVSRDGPSMACRALGGAIVDTTGAGDTFAGVFGAALGASMDRLTALKWAVAASGLACRKPGAQTAQPTRAQIEDAVRAL